MYCTCTHVHVHAIRIYTCTCTYKYTHTLHTCIYVHVHVHLSRGVDREGKSNAHLNGDYQRIGDIVVNGMKVLQLYRVFLQNQDEIVNELEFTISRSREFEQVRASLRACVRASCRHLIGACM